MVGVLRSSVSSKRMQQLEDFLGQVQILPFGVKEARHAAAIRFQPEKKDTPIGPHDTLIAATAIAHNHTLVSHNLKEFERVPGLLLEDWYSRSQPPA
jgi:tRNA(fMet)-specific endonuclease VapC